MKIHNIKVGLIKTNCYIITDEVTGETAIIDPGADFEAIKRQINGNNIIKYILITHGHYDHIMAVKEIADEYGAKVICLKGAELYLKDSNLNFATYYGFYVSVNPDIILEEGQEIELGSYKIKVLDVSGHAVGGACYYIPSENVLFTGDTLFKDTIGITDLPNGNHDLLVKNIKEKLLILPDETIVYPGHGAETTIGWEKKNNSYLK